MPADREHEPKREQDREEIPCPVCGCRGEAAQGRERFECDGIAEAHHAEGEKAATDRIADWLESKTSDDDSPLDMLTRLYAAGIRRGEHQEANP